MLNPHNWFNDAAMRPPTAGQWHRGEAKIPELFKPVKSFADCWPGDIITDGSHIGIITGVRKVVSATTTDGVVENDWGWRREQASKAVIWRSKRQ